MENSYICVLILFLLKILEKLALFIHAVITKALCRDKDDIIRELLRSFLHNYQEELKIIKGSDFVFESVELMDYKLHRVRLRRGGSYVKSPEWLEQNNQSIALNILFSSQNIEEITLLYKSEHNYNREK